MSFKRQRVSSSSSSSSSSLGYNEDMVTQISHYLPVKSIIRFRSVSKKWYSLLTHTHFLQRYASNKSRKSCLFLALRTRREPKFLSLKGEADFDFDFGHMKNSCQDELLLIRSCDGLLLFLSVNVEECYQYYICNPSTRKYTALALPYYIAKPPATVFPYLAFDPSISPHYKVIFFWNDEYLSRVFHISIYSSETRTCKKLGYTFFNQHNMFLHSGVFLNGAIHWYCDRSKSTTSSISYFDINQESFRAFPRPPAFQTPPNTCLDYFIQYFGACQGRLYLILFPSQPVFDVYELKEDYSSWFVKYTVDLHAIAVDFPEILIIDKEDNSKQYSSPSFCCLLEEHGEDPTLILSFKDRRLLVTYNLMDKTTRKLCDLPPALEEKNFYLWQQTFHCTESFSGV